MALLGNWNTGSRGVPVPKQVTIRGTTYPSQRAAAKALDVSHKSIQQAVKRGTLDNVGLRTRPNLLRKGEQWLSMKK